MKFQRIGEELDDIIIDNDTKKALNLQLSKTMSQARTNAKRETCFYCGKKVSSFCNSHSIPRFVLDNIDTDGEVLSTNAILHLPPAALKETTGLKKTGTFQILCNDCDSRIFQDYENPEAYPQSTMPDAKVIAQIALKNYLRVIAKRFFEVELEKLNIGNHPSAFFKHSIGVKKLDLTKYGNLYRKAKSASEKGYKSYYVCYYKMLDYVVPLAFQGMVVLPVGLHGEKINDIFNYNPKYDLSDLHICIFPLKTQTAIIMFVEDGDHRYRRFYKEFNTLPLEEQLGIINYTILLLSEDIAFSKSVYDIVQSENLKKCSAKSLIACSDYPYEDASTVSSSLSQDFNLADWGSIENLLSKKYALR